MRRSVIALVLVALPCAARADYVGLFSAETSHRIHVADAPSQAARVVAGIRLDDAVRFGGLPPGVSGGRVGPGAFRAGTPFAQVNAHLSVQPDGHGGSFVTERTSGASFIPGGAVAAIGIHAAATSLDLAYARARSRP